MADIRVEKRKTNVWAWVIGLVLLGLVIWGVAELMDTDREDRYGEVSSIETVLEAAPAAAELPPIVLEGLRAA